MKDGKPFIIDFEYAELHDCRRAGDIIEGGIAPNKYRFGCREIYDFCWEKGVWRSGEPRISLPLLHSGGHILYRQGICSSLELLSVKMKQHRSTR